MQLSADRAGSRSRPAVLGNFVGAGPGWIWQPRAPAAVARTRRVHRRCELCSAARRPTRAGFRASRLPEDVQLCEQAPLEPQPASVVAASGIGRHCGAALGTLSSSHSVTQALFQTESASRCSKPCNYGLSEQCTGPSRTPPPLRHRTAASAARRLRAQTARGDSCAHVGGRAVCPRSVPTAQRFALKIFPGTHAELRSCFHDEQRRTEFR